jgi:cytochrome c biogenesis protein CcdA
MNEYQLLAKRGDHKTNHILHLILSIITLGLWTPFWIIVTLSHSIERRKIDKKLEQINDYRNIGV